MSEETTRVALLRGINVGGRRRLAMADLRAGLESVGLECVRTYIQSGNVVFDVPSHPIPSEAELSETVAAVVERVGGFRVPVIVRTVAEVADAAAAHPDAASDVPPKWLHVWFLTGAASDSTPGDVGDEARFAPDRLVVAGRVAYATYPAGSGRSKLTIDVVERALGVTATARNLTTLDAIVALARPT